jgi:isopenicillin N synthase-like dioxygenase
LKQSYSSSILIFYTVLTAKVHIAKSPKMSGKFEIPIIDISGLLTGSDAEQQAVSEQIGHACQNVGFFVIVGHGVDPDLINSTWQSTKNFFDLPIEKKVELEVSAQSSYPFGYNSMGAEVLSAGKAAENEIQQVSQSSAAKNVADLKEMFSLGPQDPATGFPDRIFPKEPASFERDWTTYYATLSELARHLLRAFSRALRLPSESFFEQYITHSASALRGLNYPPVFTKSVLPGQTRASAHTDYGTMTILRTDGPGLQVSKDKDPPVWHDVPFVPGAFIINLGDLMRRWTNDQWLSTLHRVIIPTSEMEGKTLDNGEEGFTTSRRQSLAFFHNLNRDAVVSALVVPVGEKPKYEPIVAGDFLMQKHLAAVSGYK